MSSIKPSLLVSDVGSYTKHLWPIYSVFAAEWWRNDASVSSRSVCSSTGSLLTLCKVRLQDSNVTCMVVCHVQLPFPSPNFMWKGVKIYRLDAVLILQVFVFSHGCHHCCWSVWYDGTSIMCTTSVWYDWALAQPAFLFILILPIPLNASTVLIIFQFT